MHPLVRPVLARRAWRDTLMRALRIARGSPYSRNAHSKIGQAVTVCVEARARHASR